MHSDAHLIHTSKRITRPHATRICPPHSISYQRMARRPGHAALGARRRLSALYLTPRSTVPTKSSERARRTQTQTPCRHSVASNAYEGLQRAAPLSDMDTRLQTQRRLCICLSVPHNAHTRFNEMALIQYRVSSGSQVRQESKMLSFPLSFAYVLTVASATPSARGTSLKFVPPRMDQQQPAASKSLKSPR